MRFHHMYLIVLIGMLNQRMILAEVPGELKYRPHGEPRVLFDGKSLAPWKPITKNVFDRPGEVNVAEGAIRLTAGRPATGIVYAGKEPLPASNYEITLEAQRTAGDDFFCGLTFPVGQEHVTLILGGWGGGTTGLSNVDGYAAVENETTDYVDFKNGRWYKIRLRVTDGRLAAWVGQQQVVDLDRTNRTFSVWWEQEPARPLGLTTWYSGAAYRRIKLVQLEPVR